MPQDSPPSPARQRRKEARPQELLEAALALFVEKGFSATRSEELLKAVIRESLAQLIAEGSDIASTFEGSTADLLALLMHTWWERVGNTPAAGIHKVMMAEVRNFPELAEFYECEVIQPAERLLSTTLQRGIERGEFRQMPLREVTLLLFAPMIFMALHKHSIGACTVHEQIDAGAVIATHIDLVLNGLAQRPEAELIRPARLCTGGGE